MISSLVKDFANMVILQVCEMYSQNLYRCAVEIKMKIKFEGGCSP